MPTVSEVFDDLSVQLDAMGADPEEVFDEFAREDAKPRAGAR